ncbi:hypothetical protein [Nocardia bhagyanarayanae]|uniref:NACHT domain-containing protein n=1 Tax=Nocardia bhagyanarayanae TaxID=1215925 RepID=A0A543FDW7_9NOCA|nr:hypothetical protein [Nocardia bhagyanarayanae]TQM31934.1 hypothetical protein FB390_3604 [Nocardia bhagyanarayanae]
MDRGEPRLIPIADIPDYYGQLAQLPQRMVMIGGAGSGKTVAAATLVLGRLRARRDLARGRRSEEPVPVRVNAAGWDGRRDFRQWLTNRLGYDYGVNTRLAQALVDARLILPVIDGLDEMDTVETGVSRARAMLDRLNEGPWRDRPVVVVSRSEVFDQLVRLTGDRGLHGSAAIALHAFDPAQILDHLTERRDRLGDPGPAWSVVLDRIADQPDGPLAKALATPWLLGLAMTTLQHDPRTARRLADCTDEGSVTELLFDAQIRTAVESSKGIDRYEDYTVENVEKWMKSLAVGIERRHGNPDGETAVRLDEVWEIAGSRLCRMLHTVAVTFLLTIGLAVVVDSATTGPDRGIGSSIGGLACAAVVIGFVVQSSDISSRVLTAKRMAWIVPELSAFKRLKLVVGDDRAGAAVGVGALIGGLSGWTLGGLLGVVPGALLGAVVVGLWIGLPAWLNVSTRTQLGLVTNETRLIRHDLESTVVNSLITGFGACLVLPMVVWVSIDGAPARPELFSGELAVMLPTMSIGLIGGLIYGIIRGVVWQRHFVATLVFRVTKAFPGRPALFLDWARRSGLLRVTGAAYQFRHETYHRWLLQKAAGDTKR